MVGRRADGNPDRRVVYGKSRAEVQQKLDDLRRRSSAGLLGDRRVERDTVGALLLAWLEGKRGTVDDQSWRRHENNVRGHLAPALGHVKAGALKADDLRRLYAAKLRAGLSPRTVKYLHTTINQALAQAVADGELPRNVAATVKTPRLERQEMRPLTPAEVGHLLDVATAQGGA
jgi:hypothetical protein